MRRRGWCLTRGNAHVRRPPSATARRKHLTLLAPPTTARLDRRPPATQPALRLQHQQTRHRGREKGRPSGRDKEANGRELAAHTLPSVWLDSGDLFVCRRPLAKCATSTSRQTAARDFPRRRGNGGGEKRKEQSLLFLLRRNPGAVCVYLSAAFAAAAAAHGRKSAAPHWRDAICSRLLLRCVALPL